MRSVSVSSSLLLLVIAVAAVGVQAAQEEQTNSTSSSVTKKLFTYTGSLLPSDWSLVSILNDRAVIAFNNGTARNTLIDELDPKDRSFVLRLQNGTVYSTPLSSAKEKIAQWSSSVSSTVTKLSKSVKDQLDSLINNKDKNTDGPTVSNFTLIN